MTIAGFIQAVVVTSFFLALLGVILFHSVRFIMRKFPDWYWFFKYKIFRRKYNKEVVSYLIGEIDKGKNKEEFFKDLLVYGHADLKQAEEFAYIYGEILKRLKGGIDKKYE